MMEKCVFCEIVERKRPASIFYEDDIVLGFMTIGPVTTGHSLVIPKAHVAYLADMDEATGQHLFKITQRTAAAIRASGIQCEGVDLFLADGEVAFQKVFHVHMHVFPRYKGDSFKLDADWGIKSPREELDAIASQIRIAYDSLWGEK